MQGSPFNEEDFFTSIAHSGARALLIGRRALIALGLPLMTRDYDFWIHIDDIADFNRPLLDLDLFPSCQPEEARKKGRYVLENDEHVDVLVARAVPTVDGVRVSFDEVWSRRQALKIVEGTSIAIPAIADLILTKRFAARPRDLEDIRMLEVLLAEDGE